MRRAFAILSVATSFVGQAFGDVDKARLGRTTWSAFECSVFAELSHEQEEQERLFALGLESGRSFLKAMRNNEITKAEADSNVPLVVLLLLGGPSDDFIIGRIFETAVDDAYDRVVKNDENGIEMDPTKWQTDEGLKKVLAENQYRSKNCELIR